MSALTLITASTAEPVSLEDAKLWLKVPEEETDEDALIKALISAARKRVEERTRRSMLRQTFDYWIDAFPADNTPIRIGKAPLASITSITSYNSTDGSSVFASTNYTADTQSEPGRVWLVSGATWPTGLRDFNAGQIRIVAGYSTSSTGVPEELTTSIKLLVAHWYENREAVTGALVGVGIVPTEVPLTVQYLTELFELPEPG